MSGKARISHQQLASVVALFGQIATILYLPTELVAEAGPDAWIAVPFGIVGGALPVAFLLSRLARYHPRCGLGEIAERCLGRWPGKLVSLISAAYMLFLGSLVLRNVMDFSVVAILPGTPMWVLGMLMLLTVSYAVYSGVEVVARLAVLILFTAMAGVVLIPVGVLPEMEMLRILPFLGNGVAPVLRAIWLAMGWFAELFVFGAWIGLIDKPRQVLSGLLWGLLGAGVMLTLLVATTLVVFGAELTRRLTFPTYSAAQVISLAEILERLEAILITIWLAGMLIKLCVCLWSGATTLATCLGLKTDRRLILPLAAVVMALSFIWPSVSMLIRTSHRWTTLVTLPIAIGVPALLVVASWLRRTMSKGHAA